MITLKAWAKINMGLKILSKREDGFHDIETTLTTINLADILTFEENGSNIKIEAVGIDVPLEKNLCYIAADVFRKTFGLNNGVRITLTKNIPIGGGLGGGSADAACVLKGLNKLFDLNIPDNELVEAGKEIGSDVPFFIRGGAAYVRGKGDELKNFKLPKMSLIIYWPGYPILTRWAYEEYDKTLLTPLPQTDIINKDSKEKKKRRIVFSLGNDFERIAFNKHPDLRDVKANLLLAGAFIVSLSGSGSCLFTVIDENIKKKVVKYLEGISAHYFEVSTI